MSFVDIFFRDIESFYNNYEIVLIAFFLLTFIVIFYVLTKTNFLNKQRGVSALIALVLSVYFVYYIDRAQIGVVVFNYLMYFVIFALGFVLLRILFRFTHKQF